MTTTNENETVLLEFNNKPEFAPILQAFGFLEPGAHTLAQITEVFNSIGDLPDLNSQQVRERLEQLAVATSYILRDSTNQTWELSEAGANLLARASTEQEDLGEDDPLPFDPADIRFDPGQDSVFSILQQIEDGAIIVKPKFQRNFVWDIVRQSQLIESILLRIPLPPIYLSAERDDTLVVMDGLQRLTTLYRFCKEKQLKLHGLRYMKELEGLNYDQLPLNQRQVLLHRTRLNLYTITSSTPKEVRFEIFQRVNRGGLTLNDQEIRNALYQGPATDLLNFLATSAAFHRVTTNSISPRRMDDHECVLRFLAFTLYPYTNFQSSADSKAPRNLDSLLNQTMEALNTLSDQRRIELGAAFVTGLHNAEAIFGPLAFRKISLNSFDRDHLHKTGEYRWNGGKRSPISKPLFEIWTVLLQDRNPDDVQRSRNVLIEGFLGLLNTESSTNAESFTRAISLGTGSRSTIQTRFQSVQDLLNEVLS